MSGLLSREAAAEYLGVSTRTLDRIRAGGELAYVKLGGRIAYLAEDLDGASASASACRSSRRRAPGDGAASPAENIIPKGGS